MLGIHYKCLAYSKHSIKECCCSRGVFIIPMNGHAHENCKASQISNRLFCFILPLRTYQSLTHVYHTFILFIVHPT